MTRTVSHKKLIPSPLGSFSCLGMSDRIGTESYTEAFVRSTFCPFSARSMSEFAQPPQPLHLCSPPIDPTPSNRSRLKSFRISYLQSGLFSCFMAHRFFNFRKTDFVLSVMVRTFVRRRVLQILLEILTPEADIFVPNVDARITI